MVDEENRSFPVINANQTSVVELSHRQGAGSVLDKDKVCRDNDSITGGSVLVCPDTEDFLG